jgi:hypothetical protein
VLYSNEALCFNVITVLYLRLVWQDTQVAVRIPPELHKQLKEKAVNEERSMSYLINKAVEQFLKQQESAKA